MPKVKFLFAALFPDFGWVNEGETFEILADYKRSGYRWLTIELGSGDRANVIYDSEDMEVIQ